MRVRYTMRRACCDCARGISSAASPSHRKVGRIGFDEAVKDVINDYRTNRNRLFDDVERRIEMHLTPFFGNRRMVSITTADIREYLDSRQKETSVSRPSRSTKSLTCRSRPPIRGAAAA